MICCDSDSGNEDKRKQVVTCERIEFGNSHFVSICYGRISKTIQAKLLDCYYQGCQRYSWICFILKHPKLQKKKHPKAPQIFRLLLPRMSKIFMDLLYFQATQALEKEATQSTPNFQIVITMDVKDIWRYFSDLIRFIIFENSLCSRIRASSFHHVLSLNLNQGHPCM